MQHSAEQKVSKPPSQDAPARTMTRTTPPRHVLILPPHATELGPLSSSKCLPTEYCTCPDCFLHADLALWTLEHGHQEMGGSHVGIFSQVT